MSKGFLKKRDWAVEAMRAFLQSPFHRRAVFILLGKWGTGKTSALKKLAREMGKKIVNANLYLANYVKERKAEKYMWRDLIEEGWRKLFQELPEGDFLIIDKVEIFYDFPDINFLKIAEEECLLQKRKKAVIGIGGYIVGGIIYFCDDDYRLAGASDWKGRLYDLNSEFYG